MLLNLKKKNTSQNKDDKIIAAIDIGTNKIVCLIAKIEHSGEIKIIGIGHQASKGVRGGNVIDVTLAERAIGQAIHSAEQSARTHLRGHTIEQMIVSVSAKDCRAFPSSSELALKGHVVSEYHLGKLHNNCLNHHIPDTMEVIHKISFGYHIDGNDNVKNPLGMNAETIKTKALELAVPSMPLINLANAVENNHVDIQFFCLNAYASSLGALVEEESDMNAVLIDIGAGTSDIAIFSEGRLVHTASIPVGGNHITSDISKVLATPVAHAERIKTLYGSATLSPAHDNEIIDIPLIGEDDIANHTQIERSMLLGIIRPRLEEIFELIRAEIEDSGLSDLCGRRAILTGGTANLPGITEFAAFMLDKQVRVGKPNLSPKVQNPIFSNVVGLLQYGLNHVDETPAVTSPYSSWSIFEQIKQWLKDNW